MASKKEPPRGGGDISTGLTGPKRAKPSLHTPRGGAATDIHISPFVIPPAPAPFPYPSPNRHLESAAKGPS